MACAARAVWEPHGPTPGAFDPRTRAERAPPLTLPGPHDSPAPPTSQENAATAIGTPPWALIDRRRPACGAQTCRVSTAAHPRRWPSAQGRAASSAAPCPRGRRTCV
eukprot:69032-Prymnesium_polylepis.2